MIESDLFSSRYSVCLVLSNCDGDFSTMTSEFFSSSLSSRHYLWNSGQNPMYFFRTTILCYLYYCKVQLYWLKVFFFFPFSPIWIMNCGTTFLYVLSQPLCSCLQRLHFCYFCYLSANATVKFILVSPYQFGNLPIEIAANKDRRKDVAILFPVTSRVPYVHDWSIDGIISYVKSMPSLEVRPNTSLSI